MLKKFSIHAEGKPSVGELVYDEDTNVFTLTVSQEADMLDMPAFMTIMRQCGHKSVTGDVAMGFVRERLVPSERANIAQILADLDMPYYSEIMMLECLHGRCVMDEFLVEPLYKTRFD